MTKPKAIPFEKQTASQKRVTVAQDVLAQLKTRFLASTGTWVEVRFDLLPIGKNLDAEVCSLTRKQKKCEVCGIGALFVAAVERADKLKVSDLAFNKEYEEATVENYDGIKQSDCFGYLGRFFAHDQLEAIESAFEVGDGVTYHEAVSFCDQVDDASDRMRLIMENIVANKGRFKWERKPVATYSTPGFTP